MPQCMHEGHRAEAGHFTDQKGKHHIVQMTTGWNPVYRRFEDCDEGLIPPRKQGKKKELRRAQAD